MPTVTAERMPKMEEDKTARLSAWLAQAPHAVMPHALASATGLSDKDANAVIMWLATEGAATIYLLYYHRCDPETAIAKRKLDEGPPPLPFECDECSQPIESTKDLLVETLAELESDISLQ